ncbi:MAG: MaoC family dehydratase [Acholeplasmataceae bacterium]|jgi:3-hydroxybutyryl-CoA dehydratase
MLYKLGLTLQELHIGDTSSYTKTFTERDVVEFAKISGDCNPLHLDEDYAKSTRFGSRIVHGALISSLFSTVLGEQLPGNGSIYFRQDSKFVAPVYLNDTITATVKVTEINEEKGRVVFETTATNQKNENVVVGTAIVYPRRGE